MSRPGAKLSLARHCLTTMSSSGRENGLQKRLCVSEDEVKLG